MAFHESDYVDDSFLEEIQCPKCPYSFPLYLFAEHELMVHAIENSDSSSSDAEEEEEEILNPLAKAENPAPLTLEKSTKTPTKAKDVESLIDENIIALAKIVSEQENTHTVKKDKKDRVVFEDSIDDFQVADEDIKLENETVALSSFSSNSKRVEEEKPSFKAPSNVTLKGVYSKPHIRNDLTESDNEDGESLEEFWRRADVKLAQRMRKMEEVNKIDRNKY